MISKSKSIEERKSSLSIKAEETDDQKVLGETAEDETDLTATEGESSLKQEHGVNDSLCSDYTEPGTYDTWQDVYTPSPMRPDASLNVLSGTKGSSKTPVSASPYKITSYRPKRTRWMRMIKSERHQSNMPLWRRQRKSKKTRQMRHYRKG